MHEEGQRLFVQCELIASCYCRFRLRRVERSLVASGFPWGRQRGGTLPHAADHAECRAAAEDHAGACLRRVGGDAPDGLSRPTSRARTTFVWHPGASGAISNFTVPCSFGVPNYAQEGDGT